MTNTIKTPEQIAHETLHALDFGHSDDNGDWIDPKDRTIDPEDLPAFVGDAIRDGWFGGQDVVTWIVRAIEVDRAQRDAGRGVYIVQNDVGDVLDVFRDADEATAAHQDETCSVIEEIIWEPGEYAAVVTACGWSEATA